MRVAAIDAGTNTTRLLVAEVQEGGLTQVERRLIFSRLGEGVDATGRLSPRGIKDSAAAIGEFVDRSRELGAVRIRVAGTSAVREAANGEELLASVKEATGLDIEVLSGEAEAALSFAGATEDLPGGRYLVCDIGGGSTELAEGRKGETLTEKAAIDGVISLKLGVVRLTERHLAHDPPTPDELTSLEADIDRTLQAAGGVVVETFFFGFARSWFSPKKPRSRTSTTPSPMLRLRVRRCAAAFFSASMRAWRPSFLRARFAAFDTYTTPNPWFNRAHASNGFQGTSARARVSGPGRQGYLSRRPAPPGRTLSPSPWPGWRIRRR